MLSRLTRLATTSGGQTIQDYEYTYTPRGNVSSVIDNRNGVTYNYTYDDLHRLTSESVSGGGTTLSMDYDPLGNIVSKATAGNSLAYTYGPAGRPHRLTSITQNGSPAYNFAYDSNGNMTTSFDLASPSSVMQRSIVYNAENMPTQIDVFPYGGGTTTTYGFAYDGNGKRVMKRIGMLVDTVYVGPHFEVAGGIEASYVFAGSQRIAKVTAAGTQYFHQDHLGSATRVTDETGALMEQAEYMPFGQMRAGSSSPPFASNYKYTDQEMDVGTGLYNYAARMYDPIIGRFISPDPIAPEITNPQALNKYSYALNNPLRYVDPTGNYAEPFCCGPEGFEPVPPVLSQVYVPLLDSISKPAYQPGALDANGRQSTHCNEALFDDLKAEGINYKGLLGNENEKFVTADEIARNAENVAKQPGSGVKEITETEAREAAKEGKVVIAAAKAPPKGHDGKVPHGHVGRVMPSSDNKTYIGQAGKHNGVFPLNQGFSDPRMDVHFYVLSLPSNPLKP